MPATPCPRIIAFVEGTMERTFLNNNFDDIHVVTVANGDTWPVSRIAADIASKYSTRNVCYEKIIVWIDRESRAISANEIAAEIKSNLVSIGIDETKIAVCIPDRMTENIILADIELIRNHFELEHYSYGGDGLHGKNVLCSLYQAKGVHYREMTHGLTLLKKMRMQRSAVNSNSAREFVHQLNIACWWVGDP